MYQQDEKDKQLERMKERIKRERSKSPGKKKQDVIEEVGRNIRLAQRT